MASATEYVSNSMLMWRSLASRYAAHLRVGSYTFALKSSVPDTIIHAVIWSTFNQI